MTDGRPWSADDIAELRGRVAIVTGANSGIGFETARVLAARGARVILACRDEARCEAAAARIAARHQGASVETAALDLAALASVEAFAADALGRCDALHLLINNAGVMIPPHQRTRDGFELQIGVNHLGHFALTGRLIGRLLESPGSRVVLVSSLAHRIGRIDLDDLCWERRRYRRVAAYGQSKLANLLFLDELARRLETSGAGTIAAAAHPGWTNTNLVQHSGFAAFFSPLLAQGPEVGALPTLRAAGARDVANGDFYGPSGWFGLKGAPSKASRSARARDAKTAAGLWELSTRLTGVSFEPLPATRG